VVTGRDELAISWPYPTGWPCIREDFSQWLEAPLLIGLIAANPRRIDRESPPLRAASPLLITSAAIWLTNVIVCSLWYWELDRGGPVARAHATHAHPDFRFPHMQSPELAPSDWEPGCVGCL